MARISLIDEKLYQKNNGRNIILFDVYFRPFVEDCLISIYYGLLWSSPRIHLKKCWDKRNATLTIEISNIHQNSLYLLYFQSRNTSRTPRLQHIHNVPFFKFRRMDETPPIGVTMHINSHAASCSNLGCSACVEILAWPYIWNTMYVKLHVKCIYFQGNSTLTLVYSKHVIFNIFQLTVKTNHYIAVCVTPAKIGITDGIKRQNIIYM